MATLFTIGYERLLPAELDDAPPTALLCLEADPAGCHRRVICHELRRRRDDLTVVDL